MLMTETREIRGGTWSRVLGVGRVGLGSLTANGSWGSGSERHVGGMLDRKFVDSRINALRRASCGPYHSLPTWTINK
jgi:hypothetical protein